MPINSSHSRINDHRLSLGVVRYSDGETSTYHTEDALWKLVISNDCGANKMASIEVSISDLIKIKSICDDMIETLRTDGKRILPKETGEKKDSKDE